MFDVACAYEGKGYLCSFLFNGQLTSSSGQSLRLGMVSPLVSLSRYITMDKARFTALSNDYLGV